MLQFFWTPLALNLFVGALLALLLASFFLGQLLFRCVTGHDKILTLFLLFTFLATGIGSVLQFGSYVLHPGRGNYLLPWVSVFGVAATGFYTLFALQFRKNRVAKVVLLAAAIGLSLVLAVEIYVALQRLALLSEGYVEFRDAWLDFPIAGGFLAAEFVFIYHLVSAISDEFSITRTRAIGPALLCILNPQVQLGKDAAAVRAFVYSSLIPLSLGIVSVSRSYGLIEWRTAELYMSWLMLLSYSVFSLAYLNFIPERSTFQIKLVGATLVTVFGILSGVAWLIGPVYIDAFQPPDQIRNRTEIRFEPDGNGAYTASHSGFSLNSAHGEKVQDQSVPLNLAFDFPFYEQTYRKLYVREAGIVGFNHIPLWRDIQFRYGPQPAIFVLSAELIESGGEDSGLFFATTSDSATITWSNLVSAFHGSERYTFQMRLFADGVIEFAFAQVPNRPQPDLFRAHSAPMMTGIVPDYVDRNVTFVNFSSDLPVKLPVGSGVISDHRLDFLEYLNRVYQPTAFFVIFCSLAVIMLFPLFIQINLRRPLKSMMEGVQNTLHGDLDKQIPVFYPDEIGFLATSFNEMVAAQRSLVRTLEDEVAVRTGEALEYASNNVRLEERNHLTRELHDTVSQTLFSANLIAEKLPTLWQKNPEEGAKVLEEIRELNKLALVEMRDLLSHSKDEVMIAQTFGQQLKELVLRFESILHVELQIDADSSLPPKVHAAFLRIAQEALNNTVKHSGVTRATVQFDGMDGQAMLSISDQGCGIDQDAGAQASLGLHFMNERAKEIGATLDIDVVAGHRTAITVIWFENAKT